jgi:hypothetical protein
MISICMCKLDSSSKSGFSVTKYLQVVGCGGAVANVTCT